MHSSMKFMLLSVFLDYECSNSTCNLPTNDNRSIEAYYGLPVSKETFLYEDTVNPRDSDHTVYDIDLRNGGKLHRFTNQVGTAYSAIYVGSREIFSCPREDEKKMIYHWNTSKIEL